MMKSSICAWTLAGWAAIAIPDAAAGSVVGGYAPNYIFPDGTIGFHLGTSGGPIAPGVAIGFNPQPEPPGAPLPFLNLPSPSDLRVTQTCDGSVSHMCDGSVFRFELTFSGLPGLGAGELLPAVQMPNSDGVTAYRALLADGSVFVADLAFSGPPGSSVVSWAAFNPQPDPPGDFLAYDVGFTGDATVALRLSVNGVPLSFAPVPEPSTWIMMTISFATFGAMGLRRTTRARASG